jgi:XRE family transcriptional regulator, fatty acid utilization regulator
MATKQSVAEAIRSAREALGYTQQRLAELADFANLQTVSDIERGQREVRSWELVKLARALRRSVADLLGGAPEAVPARVFWRRGGLAAHHAEIESIFRERVRRYAELERLCEVPPPVALPELEIDPARSSFADASRLTSELARTLDLGSRPAASLVRVLETRFRVKIFYENLGEGESAACVRGEYGPAILMNGAEPPWRRNYNFAHELFHLITWDAVERIWPADREPDWYGRLERLANRFAADLLLPADELEVHIRERCEKGALEDLDLIDVARDFDVSTEALAWRLVSLRYQTEDEARLRLADPEFRRRDRSSMVGLWAAAPKGLPERYRRLVRMAFERGLLSRIRAAEYLERSPATLRGRGWAERGESTAPAAP